MKKALVWYTTLRDTGGFEGDSNQKSGRPIQHKTDGCAKPAVVVIWALRRQGSEAYRITLPPQVPLGPRYPQLCGKGEYAGVLELRG